MPSSSDTRVTDTIAPAFADSYLQSRSQFLEQAKSRGAVVDSLLNPTQKGIDGESLYCDIAYLDGSQKKRTFILSSGVHGVEGYCGAAFQSALLEADFFAPYYEEFNLVFVHAVNPFGFSYSCRTNEDNVDINRNFVDFETPPPFDLEYEQFRNAVFPDTWVDSSLKTITTNIKHYIDKHGAKQFQRLMTRGQYQNPEDTYFGGSKPTWSRTIWTQLCQELASKNNTIFHIDFHSGLGPFGEAEIIYGGQPKTWNINIARECFGSTDVKVPAHADSLSPSVSGALATALDHYTERAVSIALEFGTIPIEAMLSNLIADNWLLHQKQCSKQLADTIRNNIRDSFFVSDPVLRKLYWRATQDRCIQAAEGLSKL